MSFIQTPGQWTECTVTLSWECQVVFYGDWASIADDGLLVHAMNEL